MKKRISAIVICLALVISMFPATAFADGAKKIMYITINGNQATFDYDGDSHSVTGVTVTCDDPDFDPNEVSCGQARLTISRTEPGEYKSNIDPDELKYGDPTVEPEFTIGDPIKLTINEPTGGPAVSEQPQNTSTDFPHGATFTTSAEHPEDVVGYQWFEFDGGKWFKLEGESARTDTLYVTATDKFSDGHLFRCRLTDKDGKVTYTHKARLTITNAQELLKVLYVGEWALLPGESLDLDTKNIGTGEVSLATNGTDITLNNVHMTNDNIIYDYACAPAIGIMFRTEKNEEPVYNVYLQGENEINNVAHDSVGQGGTDLGVVITDENSLWPQINIKGEQPLTLRGGSIGILATGHLNLDAPIQTITNDDILGGKKMFSDAVRADEINVKKGTILDLQVNGGGLIAVSTKKSIQPSVNIEEGADVSIRGSVVPPAGGSGIDPGEESNGSVDACKYLIHSYSINIDKATVKMNGSADPDDFPGEASVDVYSGMSAEQGKGINITDSDVEIKMTAKDSNRAYVNEMDGISCDTRPVNITNSNIDVDIQSKNIASSSAFNTEVGAEIVNSTFKANVLAKMNVAGILSGGTLEVTDSNLEANIEHKLNGEIEGYRATKLTTNFSKEGYAMSANVKDGPAFMINTNHSGSTDKEYDPNYQYKRFTFNGSEVTNPVKSAISSTSRRQAGVYFYYETIYDTTDTSKPASSATIAYKKATPAPTPTPTPKVKKPGKTKVKKAAKKSAKKIKITLKKVKGAKGYQVKVYKGKKTYVKKLVKKTKFTLKSKKFKGKKKLYVKARAYKLNVKTKVYGKWCKGKKVKKY